MEGLVGMSEVQSAVQKKEETALCGRDPAPDGNSLMISSKKNKKVLISVLQKNYTVGLKTTNKNHL